MSKKLLYLKFGNNVRELIICCNSPDNLSQGSFVDSNVQQLNNTGCIVAPSMFGSGSFEKNRALVTCMGKKLGYDERRILLPRNSGECDIKYYLNGTPTDAEGNPMPYIMFHHTTQGYTNNLYYYTANNVNLGLLFSATYWAKNGSTLFTGVLYDDGTFDGGVGAVDAIMAVSVYSTTHYKWLCGHNTTTTRIISQAIIDDLAEYMSVEPEGAVVDVGEGDFDVSSDEVDFPTLPAISVLNTGLCKMFEMKNAQLQALANYLWSGLFDLDTFKKLFSDPMEALFNLAILPINESSGTTSTIRIGNITTSVTGQMVTNQYKIIDFGKINLNEFWGSFADYSPYTRLSVFLPYVGVQQISIDDVMNGSIHLKAYVDLLTGSVQYVLKSSQTNRAGHGHNSVLYTWGGNCQYQIPLSASNMSQVISSITGTVSTIASGVAATVATGGMTAPLAVGMAAGSISNAMSAKTHVQRGGGIGGSVGIFGVQTPYLILERPEQVYPENYESTKGVPSMQTKPLRSYSGYVQVEAVNLSIPGANESELRDIEAKLKGGVIV